MSNKNTHLEYVRAWITSLGDPTATERTRSKAYRDMVRIVLSQYNPQFHLDNVVVQNESKRVHRGAQHR